MAKELGVSRTPLREAMLDLERDRFVDCQPGRGFVVRLLTAKEVEELYPIVWTLEQLSIRGLRFEGLAIAELDDLNDRFERARSERTRVRLDVTWHERLAKLGANERLVSTLASLKRRITCFELAYMRSIDETPKSVRDHRRVASALRHGDGDRAASLIESHWRRGMQCVLRQMEATSK